MTEGLPGASLVERGVEDLSKGLRSAEALAVSAACTRLRRLGIDVPPLDVEDAQVALYLELGRIGVDDPYGRYNAMLRELSSFLEALEGQHRRS